MPPFSPIDTRSPPTALMHDPSREQPGRGWLAFSAPREVLIARRRRDVAPILARVGAAAGEGRWAVGFLTYEAAGAFDPVLLTHDRSAIPYAWWAIFDRAERVSLDNAIDCAPTPSPMAWRSLIDRLEHQRAIETIKQAIARGDTYQVNLTFPLQAPYDGDGFGLFLALIRAQRPPFGAYIDAGRFQLLSASPELFFARRGSTITTRPMKGTARRGRYLTEDREVRNALRASEKERAENVMIVDMMRNDLGRIARTGTVSTRQLFTVETYPTVHQLTSTIEAETDADLAQILAALFPCSSITGAPKVSTMQIIRRLEPHPRGAYTGTIGLVRPGGDARFSVAIRTVTVDRQQQTAHYGTGGGIVWDSKAEREYEECRIKALILTATRPRFDLLETLLWRPWGGYYLLDRHLARLRASADYFGRPLDDARVRAALDLAVPGFLAERQRVRLTVDRTGRPTATATPFPRTQRRAWTVRIDDQPVRASDPFLFHKTTRREIYRRARARHPDVDDVLLQNRLGQLTEASRANIVMRFGARLVTPAASCGLLPGTFRAALLDRGRIAEALLQLADLARADDVFLINSLRGIVRVRVADCLPVGQATADSAGDSA